MFWARRDRTESCRGSKAGTSCTGAESGSRVRGQRAWLSDRASSGAAVWRGPGAKAAGGRGIPLRRRAAGGAPRRPAGLAAAAARPAVEDRGARRRPGRGEGRGAPGAEKRGEAHRSTTAAGSACGRESEKLWTFCTVDDRHSSAHIE